MGPSIPLSASASSRNLVLAGLFICIWICILIYYLSIRPIWLDELIHAHAALTSLPELPSEVARNPGATPVTYAPQILLFSLFPYSLQLGRLPSLAAFLISLFVIWKLVTRRYKIAALFAVAFFAVSPFSVRYAIEMRPYAVFVLLSLVLHFIYFQLYENFSSRRVFFYIVLTLIGSYTLPLFLAIPVWHLTDAIFRYIRNADRAGAMRGGLAPVLSVPIAAACFLPWYIFASEQWGTIIRETGASGTISFSVVALILREISGAGYIGLALLAPLVLAALYDRKISIDQRIFWSIGLIIPIVFAIIADFIFEYFFAVRQIIALLAPISILSGLGAASILSRNARYAVAYLLISMAIFSIYSVKRMRTSNEDWEAAISLAMRSMPASGCLLLVPASVTPYLHVIDTQSASSTCDVSLPFSAYSPIVVVESGYQETEPAALERLERLRGNSRLTSNSKIGRFTIEVRDPTALKAPSGNPGDW